MTGQCTTEQPQRLQTVVQLASVDVYVSLWICGFAITGLSRGQRASFRATLAIQRSPCVQCTTHSWHQASAMIHYVRIACIIAAMGAVRRMIQAATLLAFDGYTAGRNDALRIAPTLQQQAAAARTRHPNAASCRHWCTDCDGERGNGICQVWLGCSTLVKHATAAAVLQNCRQ